MCLSLTTTKNPLIATEDIVCYKFLKVVDGRYSMSGKTEVTAPYRGTEYKLGKLNKIAHVRRDYAGDVEAGFHSFKSVRKAFRSAENRNSHIEHRGYYVFVCIIPKGAEYFKGRWNDCISYASNQLIVLSRNSKRSQEYVGNRPSNAKASFKR